MRFAFILAERACWPVVVMCAVLKVSASGFYAWLRSTPSTRDRKDERLKVLIRVCTRTSRANTSAAIG
jgi:putative transposase